MTGVFILEFLVKSTVYGFLCNGSRSYLRDAWNIMDFLIVCASIAGLPFEAGSGAGAIKIIRVFRILRPLRMLNKNPGMKTAIESLIKSVPEISNLLVVSVMVILLFSILGTNLFKGKFNYCHHENTTEKRIQTIWDCFDCGGEWINPGANFDNVVTSFETLFAVATTEGWVEIMWRGTDAAGQNLQPILDFNLWMTLYFISYMIIGSLFILNLFVGVVITNFNIEKDKLFRNN
jgi:voltage-dependent calcium channel T type alpha-1G